MTLPVWQGLAAREENSDIVVLASPTVTVTNQATGGQPNLFSDRDGNTALGNPFTANDDGSIEFYVEPGRYTVEAASGGNTVTWENQVIGTLHGIDQPAAGDYPVYDSANDRWHGRQPGYVDPEHATDAGGSPADDYESATNTTPPADGVVQTRDFQSANTTATPTLDGKTMTTRDGSALWAGAVSGPHELQYDLTSDTYLLLEPLPIDEDDMASDSAAAVPTQQSVKAYADTKARIATGTYTGDGSTSQSITGVGFQPVYVKIVRDAASGAQFLFETWDTLVDNDATGVAIRHIDGGSTTNHALFGNRIVSLDADGFTVDDAGGDNDPNANTVTYTYMAIG